MPLLNYEDTTTLAELVSEMDCLVAPEGHTMELHIFDSNGNKYATIVKESSSTDATLSISPEIQDS